MPKVDKQELIKRFADFIKDDDRPESISLLDDITDTLEDSTDVSGYESRITELEDKITATEKEWRDKYISRFGDYSKDVTPSTDPEPVESVVDTGANDESIEPPTFEDIATEF